MVLNNHSRDTSVPSFRPSDEGTRAFGAGPSVPGVGARPSTRPLDPRQETPVLPSGYWSRTATISLPSKAPQFL